MASPVIDTSIPIDAAFDELVRIETLTAETIRPHTETTTAILTILGTGQEAFELMISTREDFLTHATSWNQYAVDENVLGALCVKITNFFDAVEGFLLYLPGIVTQSFAFAEDPTFTAALASSGKSMAEFHIALLLPATNLVSFVDFLYNGSLYMPEDALTLATFNQVQDGVSIVQSLNGIIAIQAACHWANQPTSQITLVDAFRSCVKEGDVVRTPEGSEPVSGHIWIFTDMLMFGSPDPNSGMWGIENTIALATCNVKSLENTSFGVYDPEGTFTFSAATVEERNEWVSMISKCASAAATDADGTSSSTATLSATGALSETAAAADRIRNRMAQKQAQEEAAATATETATEVADVPAPAPAPEPTPAPSASSTSTTGSDPRRPPGPVRPPGGPTTTVVTEPVPVPAPTPVPASTPTHDPRRPTGPVRPPGQPIVTTPEPVPVPEPVPSVPVPTQDPRRPTGPVRPPGGPTTVLPIVETLVPSVPVVWSSSSSASSVPIPPGPPPPPPSSYLPLPVPVMTNAEPVHKPHFVPPPPSTVVPVPPPPSVVPVPTPPVPVLPLPIPLPQPPVPTLPLPQPPLPLPPVPVTKTPIPGPPTIPGPPSLVPGPPSLVPGPPTINKVPPPPSSTNPPPPPPPPTVESSNDARERALRLRQQVATNSSAGFAPAFPINYSANQSQFAPAFPSTFGTNAMPRPPFGMPGSSLPLPMNLPGGGLPLPLNPPRSIPFPPSSSNGLVPPPPGPLGPPGPPPPPGMMYRR